MSCQLYDSGKRWCGNAHPVTRQLRSFIMRKRGLKPLHVQEQKTPHELLPLQLRVA